MRTCLLACERLDGHDLIKLGALGDSPPLYPHIDEPLIAARQLVGLGFKGMVYSSDDPAGHMPRRLSGAASSPLSGLFLQAATPRICSSLRAPMRANRPIL